LAREFFDPEQAAAYVDLAVPTLATKRVDGTGPAYFKIGGKIRYTRDDLDAWIDAQRRVSTRSVAAAAS
jgi:hypothetical protein